LLFESFVGGDVLFEKVGVGLVFAEEGSDFAVGGGVGHCRSSAGVFGRKNSLADGSLYSASVMVRYNSPKRPSPRLDWTEAAFALSWRLRALMDS
jgi:hypothetical protein